MNPGNWNPTATPQSGGRLMLLETGSKQEGASPWSPLQPSRAPQRPPLAEWAKRKCRLQSPGPRVTERRIKRWIWNPERGLITNPGQYNCSHFYTRRNRGVGPQCWPRRKPEFKTLSVYCWTPFTSDFSFTCELRTWLRYFYILRSLIWKCFNPHTSTVDQKYPVSSRQLLKIRGSVSRM